jgi:hypothetical protein
VKRWVSEVQEALQNKSIMTQYHALGLLHQIKQHDRLAVSKLVSSMTKSSIRSPYAHCLLIRFAVQVMEEDASAQGSVFFFFSLPFFPPLILARSFASFASLLLLLFPYYCDYFLNLIAENELSIHIWRHAFDTRATS